MWWLSVTSLFLVLLQQILKLFGIGLSEVLTHQITDIINTLLALAGSLGLIYDTSITDRRQTK
ncbi:hypothetical protein FC83_GL002959 [Agrilactobacillus composti DSM 18527 = JCM 14202]|uniref:Holin n=1 Tax=Agrilactobacillus composti DSM 18527 = JCM 14202 TaxID=1423734 RepID=A0A0R1XTD6_9LACO|nr:hypothetical protein FC83_GL002959 [Agrilactobacillus composti DSM 18527 = JCM 14202]